MACDKEGCLNDIKICAVLPFYQDVDALKANLPKLFDFGIELVIAADGPFPDFPTQLSRSEDGSREVIQDYVRQGKAVLLDAGRGFMMAKLNMMFDKAAELGYDFVILVGADHYIEGDLEKYKQNIMEQCDITKPMVFEIPYKEHQLESYMNRDSPWHMLGFLKPGRIRVKHTHYLYYIDDQKKYADTVRVEGIIIHHDDSVRKPERNKMMDEYQKVNVPREDKARNKAFDEIPF